MAQAMTKKTTNWMPAVRHRRSQNAGLVTPADEVVAATVVALKEISSRTEGELESTRRVFRSAHGHSRSARRCDVDLARRYDHSRVMSRGSISFHAIVTNQRVEVVGM